MNIYESDEEDNGESGSPNLTRSLIQASGDTATSSKVDLELQKQKSERTSDMGFYELEEKYLHYKRTSAQYEALYSEYLEKFILCDRDRKMLTHKQKRVNALISRTAGLQARWDSLSLEQRKVVIVVSAVLLLLLLILLVA